MLLRLDLVFRSSENFVRPKVSKAGVRLDAGTSLLLPINWERSTDSEQTTGFNMRKLSKQ